MAIPKNKTIINIDDYTGFRWNGKHTSQLGLTIVSSSSRYSLNPISSITNNTVDVPGGDGQYFFNSTYGPKKWAINFVFDNLDDYQWRDLLNWLYHKDTSDLVFDELPYKAYNAKLEGTPTVNYLCFNETRVKQNDDSLNKNTLETFDWASYDNTAPASPSYITHNEDGTNNFDTMYYKKRIYKGEGTLNFIAFFPYAYSARDYSGKYMKYLNEIEYFPNEAEISNDYIDVGNVATITTNEKATFEINKIEATTFSGEDHFVNRTAIGESYDGHFEIFKSGKVWNYFNLKSKSEEDDYEFIFFDQCNDIRDSIEYIENDEGGKYQLIKRVGTVDLFKESTFTQLIKDKIDELKNIETEEKIEIEYDLSKIEGLLEQFNVTNEQIDNPIDILLDNNWFKKISPPEDEEVKLDSDLCFYIKSSTNKKSKKSRKGKNKEEEKKLTKLNLCFIFQDKKILNGVFSQIEENEKNPVETIDISNAAKLSTSQCLLFYPKKEETYELNSLLDISKKMSINISNNLSFSIRSKYYFDTDLQYRVHYTKIPALYDNFDEWKNSSGLLPSRIDTENNYDECLPPKDNESFRYRIYNGGDLPANFRLTLPIVGQEVSDSDLEITFALVQVKEGASPLDLGQLDVIDNILQLEKGIPYTLNSSGIDFKYYFYDISNYRNNEARFVNMVSGEIEKYNLNSYKFYKKKPLENNLNVLNSFSIRYNSKDSENSYGELVKNYTAATASWGNINNSYTNRLEIDTYKQTINFISQNTLSGKETIIPIYFTLVSGKFFTIPPQLDNLYLLVYNQRDKGNTFINNDYKNPDIEYRYTYL